MPMYQFKNYEARRIGQNLRSLRERWGLNIEQIAQKLGLSVEYLSRLEDGNQPQVPPEIFTKIIDALIPMHRGKGLPAEECLRLLLSVNEQQPPDGQLKFE